MHPKFLQLGIPLCISNSVVPSLPICFNSNVHNQKIYEICPDRGCSHVFVFRCLTENGQGGRLCPGDLLVPNEAR
jgi:hypothetical protein